MVSISGHSFNTGPYGKSESKMAIISGHFIMQTFVGYLCQVSDTGSPEPLVKQYKYL